jgi:hypothetical protein
MDKTIRALLIGVAVLAVLWVLGHIPAYFEQRRNCTRGWKVETCSQAYAKCAERQLDSKHCQEVGRACKECVGKAWKAFLWGAQADWPR